METETSETPVHSEQLANNSKPSLRPLGIFIVTMACVDSVLSFTYSRAVLGGSSFQVQSFIAFFVSAFGIAQYAVVIVLGGVLFRHWIVGIAVSVFIAGFWICSYLCWEFAHFQPIFTVSEHPSDAFSAACITPLAVLAGCLPLLLMRIGMCRARPKGNSIVELFAITSFLASVVSVTRLGNLNGDIVFSLVATALGSALTVTPASLLYFTAKDGQQGMLRFVYFASSLAVLALICSLTILSGYVSLLVLVWLFLLFATVLLGLHCMRLSGFRIPSELSSPDEGTQPTTRNDQTQFVWVIVSTIAAAFCVNLVEASLRFN